MFRKSLGIVPTDLDYGMIVAQAMLNHVRKRKLPARIHGPLTIAIGNGCESAFGVPAFFRPTLGVSHISSRFHEASKLFDRDFCFAHVERFLDRAPVLPLFFGARRFILGRAHLKPS